MIISHKYKYVYIHIPKTAGTSIRYFFRQHSKDFSVAKIGWWEDIEDYSKFPLVEKKLFQHASCVEICDYLIDEGYNPSEYFKFAFIRNPWDDMVSLYEYYLQIMSKRKVKDEGTKRKLKVANVSFERFVEEFAVGQAQYTCSRIFNNDDLCINYAGKFENINEDFSNILKKVCPTVKNKECLPHMNNTKRKPYQEYHNEKTIKIIEDAYEKIIKLGQYTF